MYDSALIQELKQVNVSSDVEKTKLNTSAVWKSASKEDQEKILTLAGVARSTVQRAYKTGSISAKLIVPIAQTLNVDPLYLTGEADERGVCTEESLREILTRWGYKDLLSKTRVATKKRGAKRQPLQDNVAVPDQDVKPATLAQETEEETAERFDKEMRETLLEEVTNPSLPQLAHQTIVSYSLTSDEQSLIDSMTEEDMILQMKAILFRAKAGGNNAEIAKKLKMLLLGLE